MKKILMSLVLLALLVSITTKAQVLDPIILDPCMRSCFMSFTDNSGSMDSAISDTHRWAHNMVFVPSNGGYAEIGLVSFGAGYEVLCEPTADREIFLQAVDSLTRMPTENDTRPSYGLRYLRDLFRERKEKDSTEVQVLLIHSDYEWYDLCESMKVLEEIIGDGVFVVLSLPAKYDVHGPGEKRMIHEENLKQVEKLGCLNVRSSYPAVKRFYRKLRAPKPCG